MGSLLRSLGRVDALAIGVGGVIGAGIFRTTGLVVAATGGLAGATGLWLLGGVVSALGALVYGDLATRVPDAGGPYAYVREAFGRAAGFVDGWLQAGVSVPARQAASFAALGEVLSDLTGLARPRVLGVGVLLVLLGVNLAGVRTGANVQRALTAAKLVALGAVIALAFLPARHTSTGDVTPAASATLVTAMAGIWFAFLGWSDVALLAEDMRAPRRDLPFVLVATVLVVTGVYVAFEAAVAVALGDDGAAAASSFPALRMAETRLGSAGERFLAVVALVSMVGGVSEGLMVRPRIAFALARDRLAPQALARVDARGTPWTAMMAHAVVVLALLTTGTFASLLLLLTLAQAMTGLLESASWFRIARLRAAVVPCPGAPWVPAVFTAANATLCVVVAIASPASLLFTALAISVLAPAGAVLAARTRH